jgi:hypothetical protein
MRFETSLDQFRTAYPSIRVNVQADKLSYCISPAFARKTVADAQKLIDQMQLPLKAVSPVGFPDVMIIQSNEN